MTLLSAAFREAVKKTKDPDQINEMTYSVSYPTGFPNFDFVNGYIQNINGQKRFELGLSDGSINMIISDSGCGKTTLATQAACNIVRGFETSCVFYEQAEVGTNIQRIKNITNFDSDEEFKKKFIVRDAGITTESIYDRVRMVHDIKVGNPEKFTYDTGIVDEFGKKIIKYQPTVFLIDSVKLVLSKKNAEEDYTNNLSMAQAAKTNSEYYTKMVPLCRSANIIMILINHITTDINTGPFMKKPEFPYLKVGEHISGGKSLVFIQNTIFRLDIKSKLSPDDGLGITGSIVNLDVVKSRTNKTSKARCLLVFDQDKGYDPDLSLFVMLKEEKLIEGAGAYLRIPGSDVKFAQKNFKNLLNTNPEFYNAFASFCINHLSSKLIDEYNAIQDANNHKANSSQVYLDALKNISFEANSKLNEAGGTEPNLSEPELVNEDYDNN